MKSGELVAGIGWDRTYSRWAFYKGGSVEFDLCAYLGVRLGRLYIYVGVERT